MKVLISLIVLAVLVCNLTSALNIFHDDFITANDQESAIRKRDINVSGGIVYINSTHNGYNAQIHKFGNDGNGGSTGGSTSGSTNSIETNIVRMGCYLDKPRRKLDGIHWVLKANSPAACVAACRQAGYKYAGPEAGNQCFCGNTIPPETISDDKCNMKCNGDGAKFISCGGWWALEVFDTGSSVRDTLRIGCFQDKGNRQLDQVHWVLSANSPAVCVAACRQAGFRYAGPEAGNQCFCGNTLPPEKIIDDKCNMKCNGAGAKSISCGGWWALEIFDTTL